jgi:hypothetical protein
MLVLPPTATPISCTVTVARLECQSETRALARPISGRGLGKMCARLNIPVPPRGYWAKLAVGKPILKNSASTFEVELAR